jgi:hypothetical protein
MFEARSRVIGDGPLTTNRDRSPIMAVFRFKHSLAGVICAVAIVGTAQAQSCPPSPSLPEYAQAFDRCARAAGLMPRDLLGRDRTEQYRDLLAGRLTAVEATVLTSTIEPALYHGLPDSADPDQIRRQRERGAREDAASGSGAIAAMAVIPRHHRTHRHYRW